MPSQVSEHGFEPSQSNCGAPPSLSRTACSAATGNTGASRQVAVNVLHSTVCQLSSRTTGCNKQAALVGCFCLSHSQCNSVPRMPRTLGIVRPQGAGCLDMCRGPTICCLAAADCGPGRWWWWSYTGLGAAVWRRWRWRRGRRRRGRQNLASRRPGQVRKAGQQRKLQARHAFMLLILPSVLPSSKLPGWRAARTRLLGSSRLRVASPIRFHTLWRPATDLLSRVVHSPPSSLAWGQAASRQPLCTLQPQLVTIARTRQCCGAGAVSRLLRQATVAIRGALFLARPRPPRPLAVAPRPLDVSPAHVTCHGTARQAHPRVAARAGADACPGRAGDLARARGGRGAAGRQGAGQGGRTSGAGSGAAARGGGGGRAARGGREGGGEGGGVARGLGTLARSAPRAL